MQMRDMMDTLSYELQLLTLNYGEHTTKALLARFGARDIEQLSMDDAEMILGEVLLMNADA